MWKAPGVFHISWWEAGSCKRLTQGLPPHRNR